MSAPTRAAAVFSPACRLTGFARRVVTTWVVIVIVVIILVDATRWWLAIPAGLALAGGRPSTAESGSESSPRLSAGLASLR